MTNKDYQEKLLPILPKKPGVYRFIDGDDTVIYVGKAKSLKARVSSYFGDRKDRLRRTKVMVKNAKRVEFTITETEQDALLLENSLIKQFQPRYNINLKDAKSYNYVCIKNERFPRVFTTRRVIRDGSTYFGPYTSKKRVTIILDLVKKLFQLRTCSYNLSERNIEQGKFKLCLEYHIKNCVGPCEGLETEESYNAKIDQIRNMLRGNFGPVKAHLRLMMEGHVERLEFEQAQQLKEKLAAFEDYQSKSTVVSQTLRDVDVFSVATDEKLAFINYLKIVNGAIINAYTQEAELNLDDEHEDILAYTIPLLRDRFNSIAPEVVVPVDLILPDESLTITVPQRGDKRKVLDMSLKNAEYARLQRRKQAILHQNKQTSAERILRTMQSDLQMDELPMHIECFDNSNIQGTNPVASCVVFKNARPSKKDYRHFKIKTVEGPDDYASMEEVVFRRYKRRLAENKSLPQLVIIDGGKGQLGAAMKSVRALGLENQMTVIGIAKRLEEIFFPGDPLPLYLDKKSESLKVIQQARNEAHRFAITFHRNLRSKNFAGTELTDIPGIGEKTADKLLRHFESVTQLKKALYSEIAEVVGAAAAKKVMQYFEEQREASTSDEVPGTEAERG